ncbi:hypothetical protein R70723_04415 [Paenibacillus sp. FSL R7-0273]|uniref:DUF6449 domain-containing protein n=1 Tax=Paenibacillus sp. FSL R7-0273 TaxID=1536772 RepID=UPI0004F676CD|nr:DUF6449 domain-containing protein [Paenibacillus sp. FSL R7-0273]AIQ45221.1 hypothetical protein R70723_04415 [Paenibacillus sp. FSL R7-0273]OMF86157.1 hypothetical protein BK144_26550 [Paenibacillus sp. FSL R7-0273]
MMRSRFFFNSSVIRQNLRQHGWIGIIYSLVLLFALPLQLFLNDDPNPERRSLDNLFFIGGEIQMLFSVTVPVAAALFLFRYLQAKASSDLWHSLPLRREHLLVSHTVSGLILVLTPVWLTAAVTGIVRTLDGNMYIYSWADVGKWCLTLTVLTLFLFIFSVFVGICTGQSVLQGVVIYVLLALPAVLLMLVNEHFSMYLYGYPAWYGLGGRNDVWSPLLHMIYVKTNPFTAGYLWLYSALSVLLFALSFLLYRKRHGEKAGQAIAFTYFNPLFKAGVMLCAMLLSGTYFAHLRYQQLGWIIAGHLIGALVGYIAAEMLIRKTWLILTRKASLEFAAYAALLGLVLYVPVSGLTGYEKRVPAADKVEGVFASDNYSTYDAYWNNAHPFTDKVNPFIKDKDYVEAVRMLHQAMTSARPRPQGGEYREFYLTYKLDNGRTLNRSYQVPVAGFEPELRTVMESQGYKSTLYRLFQLDKEIEGIRFSHYNKALIISNPQEVNELKEILKREIMNMSYEDQMGGQRSYSSIQIIGKPDPDYPYFSDYEWKHSFSELTEWLEQRGYADKIRITPADVKSAEIIPNEYAGRFSGNDRYDPERHLELARTENRLAAVQDAAAIKDILDRGRYYTNSEGGYLVKLEFKEGRRDYITLREEDLTPAIQAFLP